MNRKIEDLDPIVADKCRKLIALCAGRGIDVIVTSTLRTEDEQLALFSQGRKNLKAVNELRAAAGLPLINEEQNRIVTYGLTSVHQFSCAFDICIVKGGRALWDVKADLNDNDIPDYEEAGLIGESIGLRWGGRFRHPDYCHFQYTGGLTLDDLKAGRRPAEIKQGGYAMNLSDIGRRFEKFLKDAAVRILFSPEMKKTVIEALNRGVNIPLLDEKQEAELFELVYDTVEGAFREEINGS
jgi:peptidoglycan L-alanyl-D-glutamate endopeptidase CwlK